MHTAIRLRGVGALLRQGATDGRKSRTKATVIVDIPNPVLKFVNSLKEIGRITLDRSFSAFVAVGGWGLLPSIRPKIFAYHVLNLMDIKVILLVLTALFVVATLFFGTRNGFYDTDNYHGNGSAH